MPHCAICDHHVDAWVPYPLAHTRSEFMKLMQPVGSDLAVYQCPHCGCTDRDRHLWLYLNTIGLVNQLPGARMLHIAPEARLEPKFAALGLAEYVRGDLFPSRPGIQKVDVERMSFADESFDLIVCNHVMEHVSSPEQALAEFFRCLKPGGVLIAQTPYTPLLKKTFEMQSNPEGDFKRIFYGQDDHVRLFGNDIADFFHAAGFKGQLYPHAEVLGPCDAQALGINAREPLFLFSRPALAANDTHIDDTVADTAPAAPTDPAQQLQAQVDAVAQQYGPWTYDIPLPHGVWTRGNLKKPHTRMRKLVQAAADVCGKPLSQCRVLDLGCLDGLFSIEFALQGAQTVGIDVREANIAKAQFSQQVLGLDNLRFEVDDARNVSLATYGEFDIIICSGLLYHLMADDAIALVQNMQQMAKSAVLIDTHVALNPAVRHDHQGRTLWGQHFQEHAPQDSQATRTSRPWASADNTTSFWFTRSSLVNLLVDAGFSSSYECFTPAHLNYGQPGLECTDRCTFIALNRPVVPMQASPLVNALQEHYPEHALDFAPRAAAKAA